MDQTCPDYCKEKGHTGKGLGECIKEAQAMEDGPCYGTPCHCHRRRLVEESWALLKSKCSEENYRLSVFVDNHIQLVARPEGGAPNPTCPPILLHEGKKKEVINLSDDEGRWVDGLDLGTFKFATLSEAWDLVEARDAEYDIVRSNCATVVLRTMNNLGIEADQEIEKYMIGQLHQHGKTIEKLRKSPHVVDILPDGSNPTDYDDAELLELLIVNNIHRFGNLYDQ
jgi:hypothetical protein